MAVRLPRLLDGNLREVCRLMPTALSLQLQLNAASTATMTLDLRGPLPAMHSWVEIYTAKGSAGLYRVTNTAHQARRERTYTLLHGIDTLSDCVWAAQTDYTGTAEGYLRALLACQKAVYWQLGTCQDTGQWKKTGINYDKASDLLTEFVGDRHGYYMAYDFTTWPWTLHWLRLPDTISAEWRVSRNIHSCTVTRNDADLCTRLYFCVTSTSDVGQDGSGGGTATAVQIIDNAAAQALYGIIEKTATVDTADVADTAAWAAQFMADHAEPAVQITVDGYELARQTGDPWDSFDLGKLTRCALVDDGITVSERVVGVNYPDVLGEPEHVVVDLANRLPKFSDTIASASKTAASASATAKSASRSGGGTAKKLDHWAMVVSRQQEALDGTGLTDLWETGIELDPQTGARLYSLYQGLSSNLAELRVHNNEISTLVTKTGINSLGQAETLYTKLSQTDTDLRGEIHRAEGAEDTLAALIQANADNISAALGDIEEVDDRVQSIEGSALWMNRDSVTAATGKLVVDDQGNLHVVDGSNLYLGTGQASMGVYTDGNLNAGIIVDKINNGSTNILGDHVNISANTDFSSVVGTVNGHTTAIQQNTSDILLKVSEGDVATQLAVELNNVTISGGNLVVDGYVLASGLETAIANIGTVRVSNLQASGNVTVSGGVTASGLYIGGQGAATSVGNAIASIGTASESGGQISIPTTRLDGSQGTPINFNIAATQKYITDVAAAKATGRNSITPVLAGSATQPTQGRNMGEATGGWYYQAETSYSGEDSYDRKYSGYVRVPSYTETILTPIGAPRYFKADSIAPIGTAHVPVKQTGNLRGEARYFKADSIAPIGTAHVPVKRTGNLRGSSVSVTPIGTKHKPTLVWGNNIGTSHTPSRKRGTNIGTARTGSWKYVFDSNGNLDGYYICFSVGKTTMYEAGSSYDYYDVGTSNTLYAAGAGYSYYVVDTNADLYEADSAATYYNGGSAFEYYDVGSASTLYEAGATLTRYELLNSSEGATNTYYTGGSAFEYYDVGAASTLYEAGATLTRYELLNSSEGATNTYYTPGTEATYYTKNE